MFELPSPLQLTAVAVVREVVAGTTQGVGAFVLHLPPLTWRLYALDSSTWPAFISTPFDNRNVSRMQCYSSVPGTWYSCSVVDDEHLLVCYRLVQAI